MPQSYSDRALDRALARKEAGDTSGKALYALDPSTVTSARSKVQTGRSSRRKALRQGGYANVLAVLDDDSGATTQDRLTAARLALQVSGDLRDRVDVNVRHLVEFKTLRPLLDVTADDRRNAIEAQVVASKGTVTTSDPAKPSDAK